MRSLQTLSRTLTKKVSLSLGNILLHIIHVSIILFSMFGWILYQTRFLHLIVQFFILFSWFGLGIKKGWGYCLITDLQWKLKRSQNVILHTDSYVVWLIDKLFSISVREETANTITMVTFFSTYMISIYLYFR